MFAKCFQIGSWPFPPSSTKRETSTSATTHNPPKPTTSAPSPMPTTPAPTAERGATCVECTGLDCLLGNLPTTVCPPDHICFTSVKDIPTPGEGIEETSRVITRGCILPENCQAQPAACETVEDDVLLPDVTCQFCCEDDICNRSPQLIPDKPLTGPECVVCEQMECLLTPTPTTCKQGEVCFTQSFDNPRSGRVITRGCQTRNACDALSDYCQDGVENNISPGSTCNFCCDSDRCNRPPQLIPDKIIN